MSKAIIGGVVAVVILVITAVAYFATTSSLESRIKDETTARVVRAQRLLSNNATLEYLGLQKQIETLAADEGFVTALRTENAKDRLNAARIAFEDYNRRDDAKTPDIMALTDATGDLVAMNEGSSPVPGAWKNSEGKLKYAGVDQALSQKLIISEVWDYEKVGLMKVGIAPVIGPNTETGQPEIIGCLVLGYALSALDAQEASDMLGAEVAYFYRDTLYATSFRVKTGQAQEDTEMQGKLSSKLTENELMDHALENGRTKPQRISVGGTTYVAVAIRLPRFASAQLPDTYPPVGAGAVVMMSLDEALSPVGTVKMYILMLGIGAFLLALLGVAIAARRLLSQVDTVETGIVEISNGNLDYIFQPVGADLDGLAHALNVMLARLLGRPEPGEEEFDEDGNLITQGRVDFDEDVSPSDSANLALAQEDEADYYSRVYHEYVEARAQTGEEGEVNFDSFITKLRVNEAKLRVQYEAATVRFKVQVKDGKVKLKPVPIM